jgi:hypothetical protein
MFSRETSNGRKDWYIMHVRNGFAITTATGKVESYGFAEGFTERPGGLCTGCGRWPFGISQNFSPAVFNAHFQQRLH